MSEEFIDSEDDLDEPTDIKLDDLGLPRGTIKKIICECVPSNLRCNQESVDLIARCALDFLILLSTESNDISSQDNKKVISPDHVVKALEKLGFQEYLQEAMSVSKSHKTHTKENPRIKSKKKLESLGISQDELLRQQQALFAKAREAMSAKTQNA